MRRLLALLLLLALSIADGAAAQGNNNGGRGGDGTGSNPNAEDRDSNDTGSPFPPRGSGQVVTTPPRQVIVTPAPKRTPTRRTKPRTTRRAPRVLPGQEVLTGGVDPLHSIRTPLIRVEARLLPDGDFEFIAIGPQDESAAAVVALTDAGALFLRQRNYPGMDLRALVFDANGLSLAQIRDLLDGAAPGTEADLHSIYRFAQGAPRLYAAAMINSPDTARCVLPAEIRIGQIDGAVAADHAALSAAGLVTRSMLNETTLTPRLDHGTAVAALLVGQDDSGALAGFATGARLYAAGAFAAEGASGSSDIERIAAALDWLVSQRVQLVNLSFAGPVNTAMEGVLTAAADKGVMMIAAAGNQGAEAAVYPAAAGPVIGVTAVDAAQRRYRAANTGDHVDFAAPGVDLYVATSDGGGYASGTSYAAPILTALAARLVAQGVTDPETLRARLQSQSLDLGDSGRDSAFGWGLVKANGC